jgi:hypothetical protein
MTTLRRDPKFVALIDSYCSGIVFVIRIENGTNGRYSEVVFNSNLTVLVENKQIFTIKDVSIVPSNCNPYLPVKLGTGMFGIKEYLTSFAGSGIVAALKLPYFPKSAKSSLKYQYPNKS